jgi:hypothetical protein
MKSVVTSKTQNCNLPRLICLVDDSRVVGIYTKNHEVVIITDTDKYRIGNVIYPPLFVATEWETFKDVVTLSND